MNISILRLKSRSSAKSLKFSGRGKDCRIRNMPRKSKRRLNIRIIISFLILSQRKASKLRLLATQEAPNILYVSFRISLGTISEFSSLTPNPSWSAKRCCVPSWCRISARHRRKEKRCSGCQCTTQLPIQSLWTRQLRIQYSDRQFIHPLNNGNNSTSSAKHTAKMTKPYISPRPPTTSKKRNSKFVYWNSTY